MTTRRHAIKQLGLGAAGLVLTPSMNWRSEEPPTKKLGIALVGLGNYSTHQLGPALKHTNFCELKAIVTGTPAKAEKWAKEYQIPTGNIYNYNNFDQIKNNPAIDIVYVVLPNFLHAEYAIRAAQAGKHVICEKPMALSTKEGQAIIAACKKANKKLQVGYRLYYEPHHLEVQRIAKSGELGKTLLIESSLGFSMANPDSWRLKKAYGGWGALGDLGVYSIQGARRLVGELPKSVLAKGLIRNKAVFKDTYEIVLWQMQFPSGAMSNHSTTYTSYIDRLYGSMEKGWVEVKPAYNAVGTAGTTSSGPLTFNTPPFQQIAQMEAFAQDILQDRKPLASGEEAVIEIQIIEAIMKSIETGRAITVNYK